MYRKSSKFWDIKFEIHFLLTGNDIWTYMYTPRHAYIHTFFVCFFFAVDSSYITMWSVSLGGPMQFPHLAPTYAAINALCILANITEKVFDVLNR